MSGKKKGLLIAIIIVAVILGARYDRSVMKKYEDVKRPLAGEEAEELEYLVEAPEAGTSFAYQLRLEPLSPTREEVEDLFAAATEEIQSTIFQGRNNQEVQGNLPIRDRYAEEKLSAEWTFEPEGYFDEKGELLRDEIPESGIMMTAIVALSGFEREEILKIPFKLMPEEKAKGEVFRQELEKSLQKEKDRENEDFELPQMIDSTKISWKPVKPYMALKIALLGGVVFILLHFVEKEKRRNHLKKRREQMRRDYPEIVSNLAILVSSGMTLRQAWNKISARYSAKRNRANAGFELILQGNYEMADGESERNVYKKLAERGEIMEYRRLSRLLTQNLEKGSLRLAPLLEEESEQAFEERKRNAIKLAEEAGTKMLLPLMVLLCVVLAVVITPALLSFKA